MNSELREVTSSLVHAHAIEWDQARLLGRFEVDEALAWAAKDPDRLSSLVGALADIAAEGASQFARIVVQIAESAGYQPSPDGTTRTLIDSALNGSVVLRTVPS